MTPVIPDALIPPSLATHATVLADRALEEGRPIGEIARAESKANPTNEQLAELAKLLTPRTNKYIPIHPTDTQAAFLLLDCREALYGGAAGGGKSVALLAAALQYVDVPGYNALLLRRTFAALSKPGALIDLAHEWLQGTDAVWNEQRKQWTFPSGATLSFGYLDTENDKFQYQGAAYQFIGFDELTQFTRTQYLYLFSRKRRGKNLSGVPMRTRAASNPGGEGHEWVFERFFTEGRLKGRVFIPAKLKDNPYLDADEYRESLAELPEGERRQLEHGDWSIKEPGDWFAEDWFDVIDEDELPIVGIRWVRYWDTATTKPSKQNKDPDFTVGTLMGEFKGVYYVRHVRRFRKGPAKTLAAVKETAEDDGIEVDIWMEQEPGSQSELFIDSVGDDELKGYSFRGNRVTGPKRVRAKPFAAAASRKKVKLVRGPWNRKWLDELEAFPREGVHDDQVDSGSGAFEKLRSTSNVKIKTRPRKLPGREYLRDMDL